MRLRKSIALAATLVALTLAFFMPVRVSVNARFWGQVFDVGHIPLLGWLTVVLCYALPERLQPAARRGWVAFTLAGLFAAAVELLQPYFGRTRSLMDFVNGLLGAALALTGLLAWQRLRAWWWRGGHAAALLLVASVALWPAYEEWRGIRWRQMHFPSLGDFEAVEELKLWRPQGGSPGNLTSISFTQARATQGDNSLRVVGGPGDWVGVDYSAGDKDWRGFRALSLDVFNPRGALTIYLRVDDNGDCRKRVGRFEQGFELAHGWNHLRVTTSAIEAGPRERHLNLRLIRRLVIFTGAAEPQRHWFLDHVHLEARDD